MNLTQTFALSATLATFGYLGILHPYKQPGPDVPSATLHFREGEVVTRHHNSRYAIVHDAACNRAQGDGLSASQSPIYRREQVARAPSGKPLFLMWQSTMTVGAHERQNCVNLSSFTPENGHTYDVWQDAHVEACVMEVRDQATGQPPPTLEKHAVNGACQLG